MICFDSSILRVAGYGGDIGDGVKKGIPDLFWRFSRLVHWKRHSL